MHSIATTGCLVVALMAATPSITPATCVGDCDGDGKVTVNEVVGAVIRMLDVIDPEPGCPALDPDGNGIVAINEVVAAVNSALYGCDS